MTNKNIVDEMILEFSQNFESELGEFLFQYVTETSRGMNGSTLHERIEQINQAMIGDSMQKICDDESALIDYDEFFMQNSEMGGKAMTRLLREFAENY